MVRHLNNHVDEEWKTPSLTSRHLLGARECQGTSCRSQKLVDACFEPSRIGSANMTRSELLGANASGVLCHASKADRGRTRQVSSATPTLQSRKVVQISFRLNIFEVLYDS